MSSFVNRTFNHTDTTALTYKGNWYIYGTWTATAFGETGTLASTYDTTCNVTFTFPVPAIAFYYWGFKNSIGAQWGICIDCNPNNRTFIQIDGEDLTYNGDGPPLLLYSQTFKEPGIHEIILRNEPDPRFDGRSRITLDRFDIEVPVNNSGSPAITATVPPSSSPTASSPSRAYSSQKEATPLGAILGGALGGSVLILFLLCLLFRSRRQEIFNSVESPFLVHVGDSTQKHSHLLLPFVNNVPERNRKQDTTSNPPLAVAPLAVTPLAVILPSSVTSGPTTLHNQPPSLRRPIREIDAGPANTTDDNQLGDVLPPEYNQVFA